MRISRNLIAPRAARILMVLLLLYPIPLPFLTGCGGGGGGGGVSQDTSEEYPSVLEWEQLPTFADNSALDPLTDIDRYDIYINKTGFFDPEIDEPVASVAAVEDVLLGETYITQPLWRFDLALLEPFGITPGYWVSVRSVGLDEQASEFSDPVIWGEYPYEEQMK